MSIARPLSKSLRALTLVLSLVLAPAAVFAAGDQAELRTEELSVKSSSAEHRFTVEVAATNQDRARGLMFREEMEEDHGMLFIFEGEGERFFWMKNTPLPLDIIYISAAGQIVSIAEDTTPFSEGIIPSHKPAQYVLEVNAGLSKKLGIAVGDQVTSPSMTNE